MLIPQTNFPICFVKSQSRENTLVRRIERPRGNDAVYFRALQNHSRIPYLISVLFRQVIILVDRLNTSVDRLN